METTNQAELNQQPTQNGKTKFCKFCGSVIPDDAVICTKCGRQVETPVGANGAVPNIVINNSNANANLNANMAMIFPPKNKWVSLLLCIFFGWLGAHKFYEGKIGMGILYLLTIGLFGIGILVDFIVLLFKPNPYYVR